MLFGFDVHHSFAGSRALITLFFIRRPFVSLLSLCKENPVSSESANRLKLVPKVSKMHLFGRHYCPLAPVPVSYRHTTFQRPRIASRDVVLGLPH